VRRVDEQSQRKKCRYAMTQIKGTVFKTSKRILAENYVDEK
jgi:ribosomal protein S13